MTDRLKLNGHAHAPTAEQVQLVPARIRTAGTAQTPDGGVVLVLECQVGPQVVHLAFPPGDLRAVLIQAGQFFTPPPFSPIVLPGQG